MMRENINAGDTVSAERSLTLLLFFFHIVKNFRLVPSPENQAYLPRILAIIWTPSAVTEIARYAFI